MPASSHPRCPRPSSELTAAYLEREKDREVIYSLEHRLQDAEEHFKQQRAEIDRERRKENRELEEKKTQVTELQEWADEQLDNMRRLCARFPEGYGAWRCDLDEWWKRTNSIIDGVKRRPKAETSSYQEQEKDDTPRALGGLWPSPTWSPNQDNGFETNLHDAMNMICDDVVETEDNGAQTDNEQPASPSTELRKCRCPSPLNLAEELEIEQRRYAEACDEVDAVYRARIEALTQCAFEEARAASVSEADANELRKLIMDLRLKRDLLAGETLSLRAIVEKWMREKKVERERMDGGQEPDEREQMEWKK